jgi:hypothetical protein
MTRTLIIESIGDSEQTVPTQREIHDHFANLVFFLLWAERDDPKQMWGGVSITDAIDSLAAIAGWDSKKMRELI